MNSNGIKTPKFNPPNPNPNPMLTSPPAVVDEDDALARSSILSREEVLRRRARRLKKLEKEYRRQYWGLVEEVRVKHRDYYWEHGRSPVENEDEGQNGNGEGQNGNLGERKRCPVAGCKAKAMPMTRFCYQHILSDREQVLYRPCGFVTRSMQVQVKCGKPVLRSAVPCLCPVHFQKIQKQISQALKRAGLGVSSSTNFAPKFHVLVAECVKQIQSRRKLLAAKKADKPSAPAMKTTDQTELGSICKDLPLLVDEKFSTLQDNNTAGMADKNITEMAESKPSEAPVCRGRDQKLNDGGVHLSLQANAIQPCM